MDGTVVYVLPFVILRCEHWIRSPQEHAGDDLEDETAEDDEAKEDYGSRSQSMFHCLMEPGQKMSY